MCHPIVGNSMAHRLDHTVFYKSHGLFIQFSACSGHDRFVKFNRRGVLISIGRRANSLKINRWDARLLETLE